MVISMIIVGYVLLFGGLGIFLQGWRELYRAHKEKRLATGGLYSLLRPSIHQTVHRAFWTVWGGIS